MSSIFFRFWKFFFRGSSLPLYPAEFLSRLWGNGGKQHPSESMGCVFLGFGRSLDCPFFPLCLLIVDQASGFVFGTHLESKDHHRPEFLNPMLNVIEKNAYLPQEIWVKKEELFQLLGVLVSNLGLKMKQVKRLNQLEYVKKSMNSYFSSAKMRRDKKREKGNRSNIYFSCYDTRLNQSAEKEGIIILS